MRLPRDFQPGRIYGVTQRGNRGQWVHGDRDDFQEAMRLMEKYAQVHEVRIHAFVLMHNHSHWMFEASSEESISNLMRDMQGNFSRYLNRKYKKRPWMLLAPHLRWRRGGRGFSRYLRAGPVNWSPRFHAEELDTAGYRTFMKYVETNPVRAKLVKRAERWEWSSAGAHCRGDDLGGLLYLDVWRHVLGRPETIAEDWREYLTGPTDSDVAAVRMPVRREGAHNRPMGWIRPAVAVSAGALPG